jgi:uracil-DNA glycosylase
LANSLIVQKLMSEIFQRALGETREALAGRVGSTRRVSASRAALERLASARPRVGASRVREEQVDPLELLRREALQCVLCPHLVRSRTGVVFGTGNPHADLMFVGEAPGADEDKQGEPFVGRAGQLLTKMITAMGLTREAVYIANVLKCRPDMPEGSTGNRKPRPEEMETCLPWLRKQVAIVQPKVIVALGATAAQGLLGIEDPIGKIRGKWQAFGEIPAIVTYHPSYLLRNGSITEKRKVWEDLLLAMEKLGLPISDKQRKFFT